MEEGYYIKKEKSRALAHCEELLIDDLVCLVKLSVIALKDGDGHKANLALSLH